MMSERFPAWQLARKAYVGFLESMFLRFFASSLVRPWLRSPSAAYSDALFRVSIGVAAPFVCLVAILVLSTKATVPDLLPGRSAFFIVLTVYGALSPATYFTLDPRFRHYVETPERVRNDGEKPRTRGEVLFELVSWLCALGSVIVLPMTL